MDSSSEASEPDICPSPPKKVKRSPWSECENKCMEEKVKIPAQTATLPAQPKGMFAFLAYFLIECSFKNT